MLPSLALLKPMLLLSAALAIAPIQCASRRSFEQRREETPAEALWLLAERFQLEQNPQSQRRTLQFLVERYPSTRFAARARVVLDEPNSEFAPTNEDDAAVHPQTGAVVGP